MADEMAWVVLIGMPRRVATSITVPAAVSAAKPWTGRRSTRRWPMVLMIRQPPKDVPRPIAVAAVIMTQNRTMPNAKEPAQGSLANFPVRGPEAVDQLRIG